MEIKRKGLIKVINLVLLVVAVFIQTKYGQWPNGEQVSHRQIGEIVKVVDGDTYKVNIGDKDITVRLIGVDTPEAVHPRKDKNTEEGIYVSNIMKDLLPNGTIVELEYDTQQIDKYNRHLVYLYKDGIMINEWLLSKGYAKLSTYPPNVKYVDRFKEAIK